MKKTLDDFGILELFVYKDERFRWVFDDSENGLSQEPFVAGMNLVIDYLVESLPNKGLNGFHLYMREFIAGADADNAIELSHHSSLNHPIIGQSNYYWCKHLKIKAWLCNNLYKYISETPQVLQIWAKS